MYKISAVDFSLSPPNAPDIQEATAADITLSLKLLLPQKILSGSSADVSKSKTRRLFNSMTRF